MKFDPKISLDKSWKFTPQVLILIALGIIVIFGAVIFWRQGLLPEPPEQPPVSPEELSVANPQIPQGPISGINAKILTIEETEDGETKLSLRSDLGKTYSVAINTTTSVFLLSRTFRETEVTSTREDGAIQDLEVGKRIYLQSDSDLMKTFELSPENIKSIDIYVN